MFTRWFVFSRIPPGKAGCCGAPRTRDQCPDRCRHCRQGMAGGSGWEEGAALPCPCLEGQHVPAAPSLPSLLPLPSLNSVLSLFHISRATLNFACPSEVLLCSRLTLRVHFRIWKVHKFDSILISLIISLFVDACALTPYCFSGCPLCCVLLAADVSRP